MEQGYEDTRFENTVDRHFHCPICLNVLRDPVQCRRNQHYFCTPCITKHLQENSQTCPTCMEELTIETLGRPTRLLTNLVSTFKISCDYGERGCREMVELGALKRHVGVCDFGPVMCSNDECMHVVNKRDKEVHETKMCDFRMIKCDYCGEEMQFVKIKSHKCPTRKEIDEIKVDLSEVKDKLNQLCSAQQEVSKEMRSIITMMNDIKESISNMSEPVSPHPPNVNEDIVIAGGLNKKSVETFSWTNNTWTHLGEMNQCRSLATSFVYQNHMVATGGFSSYAIDSMDSMEKMDLNQKAGQWMCSPVKLPLTCRGHRTLLHQNKLIVIGGDGNETSTSNTIFEVSLTHPYSSKLLTHMPLPRCFHGAERIDDKIYILGGKTKIEIQRNHSTNNVLMYDATTNRCKQMTPLPFAVSLMATVCWKDNVILLGGIDENDRALNTAIMYNVNTGKSTMLQEMKKKRRGCAAVITGNKIVVMGGKDEKPVILTSVECYSFDTKVWEDLPPMVETRVYPTAVVKPTHT